MKKSRNKSQTKLKSIPNDSILSSSSRSLKKQRWNTIQNDLISALDTWEELNKKNVKLSPEEEQFQKIKTIIGQLREKLEQF